jgi:hypothetical protein
MMNHAPTRGSDARDLQQNTSNGSTNRVLDRKSIVERCARVTCALAGQDGVPVGSRCLASLSFSHEQPYNMFLLSADATYSQPAEGQEFYMIVPTNDFDGIRTRTDPILRLRVLRTFEVPLLEGLDMIVVAALADATHGSCRTIRVTYSGMQ